jgi:hypothetical protein
LVLEEVSNNTYFLFFSTKSYHPIPWRDSILHTAQAETLPLDHSARANFIFLHLPTFRTHRNKVFCNNIAK